MLPGFNLSPETPASIAASKLVLIVDVGDDRYRGAWHHDREALGCFNGVAGDSHDVGPGTGQGVDLGKSAVHIVGLGRGHRLNGDGRSPPTGTFPTIRGESFDGRSSCSLPTRSD